MLLGLHLRDFLWHKFPQCLPGTSPCMFPWLTISNLCSNVTSSERLPWSLYLKYSVSSMHRHFHIQSHRNSLPLSYFLLLFSTYYYLTLYYTFVYYLSYIDWKLYDSRNFILFKHLEQYLVNRHLINIFKTWPKKIRLTEKQQRIPRTSPNIAGHTYFPEVQGRKKKEPSKYQM